MEDEHETLLEKMKKIRDELWGGEPPWEQPTFEQFRKMAENKQKEEQKNRQHYEDILAEHIRNS